MQAEGEGGSERSGGGGTAAAPLHAHDWLYQESSPDGGGLSDDAVTDGGAFTSRQLTEDSQFAPLVQQAGGSNGLYDDSDASALVQDAQSNGGSGSCAEEAQAPASSSGGAAAQHAVAAQARDAPPAAHAGDAAGRAPSRSEGLLHAAAAYRAGQGGDRLNGDADSGGAATPPAAAATHGHQAQPSQPAAAQSPHPAEQMVAAHQLSSVTGSSMRDGSHATDTASDASSALRQAQPHPPDCGVADGTAHAQRPLLGAPKPSSAPFLAQAEQDDNADRAQAASASSAGTQHAASRRGAEAVAESQVHDGDVDDAVIAQAEAAARIAQMRQQEAGRQLPTGGYVMGDNGEWRHVRHASGNA